MEWSPRDTLDGRVVDYCLLCRSRDVERRFPDRPGVFLFLDIDMNVLYVGRSEPSGLRDAALVARDERGKASGALFAKWLATESEGEAASLEEYLVGKYCPPYNA